MALQTISQVSKSLNLSTRTLRYYEQIGLIRSSEKADYAYRTYDGETVARIGQIVVLRKLRIPLKQIAVILQNGHNTEIIRTFERSLSEIDEEITALSTIRSILYAFVARLSENAETNIRLALFDDVSLLSIVDSLALTKRSIKEEKTMEELNKASETINKLTDRDVRIVYLPPAMVAAAHIIGFAPDGKDNGFYPEGKTNEIMSEFIRSSHLCQRSPGFRHYGFNHPNGTNSGGPSDDHGYERWITIPDDMEVPAPLEKKHFPGGLYAAHMIPMGAFEEWGWLWEWVKNSKQYEMIQGDPDCMGGLLEEHLNAYGYYLSEKTDDSNLQLDLLIPIREK